MKINLQGFKKNFFSGNSQNPLPSALDVAMNKLQSGKYGNGNTFDNISIPHILTSDYAEPLKYDAAKQRIENINPSGEDPEAVSPFDSRQGINGNLSQLAATMRILEEQMIARPSFKTLELYDLAQQNYIELGGSAEMLEAFNSMRPVDPSKISGLATAAGIAAISSLLIFGNSYHKKNAGDKTHPDMPAMSIDNITKYLNSGFDKILKSVEAGLTDMGDGIDYLIMNSAAKSFGAEPQNNALHRHYLNHVSDRSLHGFVMRAYGPPIKHTPGQESGEAMITTDLPQHNIDVVTYSQFKNIVPKLIRAAKKMGYNTDADQKIYAENLRFFEDNPSKYHILDLSNADEKFLADTYAKFINQVEQNDPWGFISKEEAEFIQDYLDRLGFDNVVIPVLVKGYDAEGRNKETIARLDILSRYDANKPPVIKKLRDVHLKEGMSDARIDSVYQVTDPEGNHVEVYPFMPRGFNNRLFLTDDNGDGIYDLEVDGKIGYDNVDSSETAKRLGLTLLALDDKGNYAKSVLDSIEIMNAIAPAARTSTLRPCESSWKNTAGFEGGRNSPVGAFGTPNDFMAYFRAKHKSGFSGTGTFYSGDGSEEGTGFEAMLDFYKALSQNLGIDIGIGGFHSWAMDQKKPEFNRRFSYDTELLGHLDAELFNRVRLGLAMKHASSGTDMPDGATAYSPEHMAYNILAMGNPFSKILIGGGMRNSNDAPLSIDDVAGNIQLMAGYGIPMDLASSLIRNLDFYKNLNPDIADLNNGAIFAYVKDHKAAHSDPSGNSGGAERNIKRFIAAGNYHFNDDVGVTLYFVGENKDNEQVVMPMYVTMPNGDIREIEGKQVVHEFPGYFSGKLGALVQLGNFDVGGSVITGNENRGFSIGANYHFNKGGR